MNHCFCFLPYTYAMKKKNNDIPASANWIFEDLYSKGFLLKVVTPLIISYLAYHIGLFINLKNLSATPLASQIFNAVAYLLVTYWLVRMNFTIWCAKLQVTGESETRIFPFITTKTRWYTILLITNIIIALLLSIFEISAGMAAHLGILLLFFLGRFVAIGLNDFYYNIRYHLSYFYPSILSIVILAFVIAKQEQFGDFFLELSRSPWNFIGFALIFGVSIITVWFAPSYLFFTDHFQLDEEKSREVSERFQIWQKGLLILLSVTTFASRLIPAGYHAIYRRLTTNRTETDLMNLLWKHKNEINNNITYQMESKGFTIVRILLGLCYIATLATLAGNVWLKSFGIHWLGINSAIMLLALILPLTMSYLYFYSYEKNKDKNPEKIRDLLQYSWVLLTVVFIVLTIVIFILTILNKTDYQQSRLFLALFLFVITTIFTSLPLIGFGYTFQRLYYYLKSTSVPGLEVLKKYARFFTAIVLGSNASVAGLSLIVVIIMLLVPFEKAYPIISKINTINIYILLVNGLIAGITLIDRFTRIKSKVHHLYHPDKAGISTAAKTWAIILIVVLPVLMLLRGEGNSYHEVPYTETAPTKNLDLTKYTESFLDNLQADSTNRAPIILIAADGGGLKAATWTMLNLHKLDQMGMYEDNVFLMAGASGGSLGQGLYTYMKAQDLASDQISDIIDILGNSNFVSGDLTGVMTRWPYNFFPQIKNWKWPGSAQDRMEAMTETYFNIIQTSVGQSTDSTNRWSYTALRALPYSTIWTDRNTTIPHLPVFITNSARAEDGVKAWTHPFEINPFMSAGAVDLSTYELGGKPTTYISFPDALFLTNRFPIMSPAAKIKGKGHFIDAGAVDNSGLETLIQFLSKMKARAVMGDSTFIDFFKEVKNRDIKVITIRNARGRFIDGQFTQQVDTALEATNRKSELSAFFGAVVSAGIYGKPKVIDDIVENGEAHELFPIENLIKVDLPFRLEPDMIESHFFRKITPKVFEDIKVEINQINYQIDSTYGNPQVVEPALGRLLSKPSQDYMKRMLQHPLIEREYQKLDSTVKIKGIR